MQEDFLQYLWKYGLFPADKLYTMQKQRVEVLSPGQLNTDSGPDFLMARVRIGGTVWAGHVEIHVKASDWYRHNHQADPAYEPVVLHVVYEADCAVKRMAGEEIPMVVLPVKPSYLDNYHRILSTLSPVPCESSWKRLPSAEVENWICSMGIERMQAKSAEVFARLDRNRGGWSETWLQILFRSFGFGINQETFESLGRSVPMAAIRSAEGNPLRMEALLFGQADLIPVRHPDNYSGVLMAEYRFVRNKFNLVTLKNPGWKFLRMRPANFPTIRIAQLASYLAVNPGRPGDEPSGAAPAFNFRVSEYWQEHYDFGKKWESGTATFGPSTINLLMINAVLPFQACFANRGGDAGAWEKWMSNLEKLPPEENRITRLWNGYGYRVPNAFYSQSFLHLYHAYCAGRNCLNCRIGQALIMGRGN